MKKLLCDLEGPNQKEPKWHTLSHVIFLVDSVRNPWPPKILLTDFFLNCPTQQHKIPSSSFECHYLFVYKQQEWR